MTQPAGPILGSVHLDDYSSTRFRWNEEIGLSNPASRPIGSIQDTFAGPYRITPASVAFPAKEVDLPGYLLQVNGLAESYRRLARLYALVGASGSVSVLQMGGMFLNVIPEAPLVEKLKAHRTQVDFSMKATAVPAPWVSMAGSLEGGSYGLAMQGDTLNHTVGGASRTLDVFALAAGAQPSITNPGTAPTPLVLTISISGPRTTRFYIRTTAPGYTKRISVTPITGGVVQLTEAHGLFVPPGTCSLRYEEADGSLIAGTIASSIYGTRWRYEGIDDTLAEQGPAILYNTRQTRAYYHQATLSASAGIRTGHPDQPRFGTTGVYSAANVGLIVEPDRTNLVLQSQALNTGPWATSVGAVTNNNSTAPDGTTTSSRFVAAAGIGATCQQSITLTAAPYVVSFYARSTAAGAQTIAVTMGALLSQVVTTGTNWARYQYLVTGTAAAYNLTFQDNALAAADVQLWGVQVELATGQTAANATSYIPTTSTTQRRFPDGLGVRRFENLVAWSNRFDKTTATSTTRGLWYIAGAVTPTTSTRQVGPSGVTDASSMVFGAANAGLQQRLLNAEQLAGKTIVFSVWVKNSSSTPSSNAFIRIDEIGGSGAGQSDNSFANLDDNWTRITVQRKLTAPTDVSVHIRSSGAITYYFAHAQVAILGDGSYPLSTSAAISETMPYVETFATPYYAPVGWLWPEWLTQNGYIEADILLGETANPNSSSRTILGSGTNTYANPNLWPGSIYRSSATGSGANDIAYAKQNGTGTTNATYTPAASLYDGAFHKYRVEWVNYTLAGSRTIRLYLYIDGVAVSSATTGGASLWLRPNILEIVNQTTPAFQTMKNITIGSPSLPAGAIPEPY